MAVPDIERIERLDPAGDLAMSLYRPLHDPRSNLGFKLVRSGRPILLSDVLPHLENMGVRVVDERPYEIKPAGGQTVWIYDFGLAFDGADDLEPEGVREIFQDAFATTWRGDAESDGLNRLVLRAHLPWREIAVLRAYCRYLRQTKAPYSQGYMEQAVTGYPQIARLLVELFRSRFDPASAGAGADELGERIERALDEVPSLDEDRILRSLLRLVRATLRTNYFQTAENGGPKPYLSLKLDPSRSPSFRCRGRCSRSSSTHRGPRACISGPGRWPGAGSAGRTSARTSAPRSSGS